jgi:hypothetical protein
LFNNVYADTEFYKQTLDKPTFTGNWVKQLISIIKDFPDRKFIRVCGDTTAVIPELQALANMRSITIADFVGLLNNPRIL